MTKREFNPTSSSLTDSQAREIAADSKTCSDAKPCRPNYCDGCPSAPEDESEWVLLDRRLNGHQDVDTPEPQYNPDDVALKQPRYQDARGEDWIDEFARAATMDEFRGAMRFTVGKYNRRIGKKDDELQEVRKMKDYCERWEQYLLANR